MGAGSSTGHATHAIAIALLSAALLYVAWRHSQTQQELRALRSLVDASVSLHELEEQVMPAIDALEQEAGRMKRDMQLLARAAALPTAKRAAAPCPQGHGPAEDEDGEGNEKVSEPDREGTWEDEEEDEVNVHSGGPRVASDIPPEISLLMGMGSLLTSSPRLQPGAAGMPVARVLISTGQGSQSRHQLGPVVSELAENSSEDASLAGDGGAVKSVLAQLPSATPAKE